jgi:2-polyprenyl-3-methyl-5-hydroxy-6-metoxy-1,4-benzoquinol methylase
LKNEPHESASTQSQSALWRDADLEFVDRCPLCLSSRCKPAVSGVRDWFFSKTAFDWTYWRCEKCDSLYLSPRPRQDAIGKAYLRYYTHGDVAEAGVSRPSFRLRLANEYMYRKFSVEVGPRFRSNVLGRWVHLLRPLAAPKFPVEHLASRPAGSFLDIGCGDGFVMELARKLGWKTRGIEIDAEAVAVCRRKGLDVQQGSYREVDSLDKKFDCIVVSHVIEHVHDPVDFVRVLAKALSPGGTAYVSFPNPRSYMLSLFGRYWRGLEAPRHLALPSVKQFLTLLDSVGLEGELQSSPIHTFGQSMSAAAPGLGSVAALGGAIVHAVTSLSKTPSLRQDMIQIVAYPRRVAAGERRAD